MDPGTVSMTAAAISLIVLVISAFMDIRNREVSDGCWAVMFAVGAAVIALGTLTSDLTASLVAAASVVLIAMDLLWDRSGSAVDFILYVLIGASSVAAFLLLDGDAAYVYASIPVMYVLMLALYYTGAVEGGADAKAIIAIAAVMPSYAPLLDIGASAPEPAVFLFPPALAVLIVAAVLTILLVPCYLALNLVRGDRMFPQMLMGYRRDVPEDGAHLWPLDTVEDGNLVHGRRPWHDEHAFSKLREAGAEKVWVTPIIPFIVPTTIAYAIIWLFGNPLFLLI